MNVGSMRGWEPDSSSYLLCVLKATFNFAFCVDAGWQDAASLYTLMFLAYCIPWK